MFKQLKPIVILPILLSVLTSLQADDTNTTQEDHEVSFRVMPIVSSNPTSGTGAGAAGMMIYKVDKDSSPSQTIVTGQYTNTKSYSAFAVNKMFFGSDDFQSNTVVGMLYNNSEIDLGEYVPATFNVDPNAHFDVTIYMIAQQFLYQIKEDVYVGGQLFYINQTFSPQNPTGQHLS